MALTQGDPLSLAGVNQKLIDTLGYKRVVHLAGVTKSQIYVRAKDGSKCGLDDLHPYLVLDAEYFKKTRKKVLIPLLDNYVEQLAEHPHDAKPLEIAMLEVGAATGLVQDTTVQITNPHGDGGTQITKDERNELVSKLVDLQNAVKAALKSANDGGNVVTLPHKGPVK